MRSPFPSVPGTEQKSPGGFSLSQDCAEAEHRHIPVVEHHLLRHKFIPDLKCLYHLLVVADGLHQVSAGSKMLIFQSLNMYHQGIAKIDDVFISGDSEDIIVKFPVAFKAVQVPVLFDCDSEFFVDLL